MNLCNRFEEEGLLILERGEELSEHFETCEECLKARKIYEQLADDIRIGFDNIEPPSNWRAAAFDQMKAASTNKPKRKVIGWSSALAAMLVAVVWTLNFLPNVEPSLTTSITKGGEVYRGQQIQPGDTLNINAITDASTVEIRVYLDDQSLVYRCGKLNACSKIGNEIATSMELEGIGEYQALLIYSNAALTANITGSIDQDVLAVREQGATVIIAASITVR